MPAFSSTYLVPPLPDLSWFAPNRHLSLQLNLQPPHSWHIAFIHFLAYKLCPHLLSAVIPLVLFGVLWRCRDQSTMFRGTWVPRLVKRLPSAQVMIARSWDRALHQAPGSVGSLLLPLPLPATLPLSLSLKWMNKIIKKKKKPEQSTMFNQKLEVCIDFGTPLLPQTLIIPHFSFSYNRIIISLIIEMIIFISFRSQ